jgi:hypothetical protein
MALALRIVGVVYVVALVALGGLWRGALRQPSPAGEAEAAASNVIPFRSAAAPPAAAEAPES